jgi:hypothetical protein
MRNGIEMKIAILCETSGTKTKKDTEMNHEMKGAKNERL